MGRRHWPARCLPAPYRPTPRPVTPPPVGTTLRPSALCALPSPSSARGRGTASLCVPSESTWETPTSTVCTTWSGYESLTYTTKHRHAPGFAKRLSNCVYCPIPACGVWRPRPGSRSVCRRPHHTRERRVCAWAGSHRGGGAHSEGTELNTSSDSCF